MTAKQILQTASLILFIAIVSPASAAIIAPSNAKVNNEESIRSQQLIQRLEEIKSMDKSEMTRLEKKELRKEVVEIKKEMKVMSGGVYLSIGAIIIVILLLILLL